MSRLAPIPPDPPPKQRRTRRGRRHPEAALAVEAARAAPVAVSWRWPTRWHVRLHAYGSVVRRMARSYLEATHVRAEALASAKYSHAWIEATTETL